MNKTNDTVIFKMLKENRYYYIYKAPGLIDNFQVCKQFGCIGSASCVNRYKPFENEGEAIKYMNKTRKRLIDSGYKPCDGDE